MKMEGAISKTGVLKKRQGMLRRKEGRFFVLTNEGGLFQAKGIAAEFDSLKLVLTLTTSTDVRLEKAGSGAAFLAGAAANLPRHSSHPTGESTSVIKVYNRGQKGPLAELEAMSDNETAAWSEAMKDVIELLGMINGDPSCALHRPLQGLQKGEEGWYLEPTGRMALYTLNQKGMWKVQDRREYDEATIMYWMANQQQRRRADYPVQGDGDSLGEDSVERVKPDYPVNARQEPSSGFAATRADYPVQSNKQGGGTRAMAATSTVAAPGVRDAREDRPARSVTGVGGNIAGGGGEMPMATSGRPPTLPSIFAVGKGDEDADTDNLVLRRPTSGERYSSEGTGERGGRGERASAAPQGRATEEMVAGGLSRHGAAKAARGRVSPGMEVLQSSMTA